MCIKKIFDLAGKYAGQNRQIRGCLMEYLKKEARVLPFAIKSNRQPSTMRARKSSRSQGKSCSCKKVYDTTLYQ
jgi:hypothetical protein